MIVPDGDPKQPPDFSSVNLSYKNLSGVDLSDSILGGSNFSNSDLSLATIRGDRATSADFYCCDLMLNLRLLE